MEANREFRILWFIVIAVAILLVIILVGMFWRGNRDEPAPIQDTPVPVVAQIVRE